MSFAVPFAFALWFHCADHSVPRLKLVLVILFLVNRNVVLPSFLDTTDFWMLILCPELTLWSWGFSASCRGCSHIESPAGVPLVPPAPASTSSLRGTVGASYLCPELSPCAVRRGWPCAEGASFRVCCVGKAMELSRALPVSVEETVWLLPPLTLLT